MFINQEDLKQKLNEANNLKRLTFYAITISSVATVTAIVFVPMLYNYVQYIHSSLNSELEFCHHRVNGLWKEYHNNIEPKLERVKRKILYNAFESTNLSHRARSATSFKNVNNNFKATDLGIVKKTQLIENNILYKYGLPGPVGLPGQDGINGKKIFN